jgi:hypothetical protein
MGNSMAGADGTDAAVAAVPVRRRVPEKRDVQYATGPGGTLQVQTRDVETAEGVVNSAERKALDSSSPVQPARLPLGALERSIANRATGQAGSITDSTMMSSKANKLLMVERQSCAEYFLDLSRQKEPERLRAVPIFSGRKTRPPRDSATTHGDPTFSKTSMML